MRKLVRTGLLVGLLVLALAAPAQAATTIGSSLAASPGNGSCGSPDPCTFVQRTLTGRQLTAPADGVIVRWRLRHGGWFSGSGSAALRVVRGTGASSTAVAGAVDSEALVNTFTTEVFDARIPISAGDAIGLECCDVATTFATTPVSGATSDFWNPSLADGETRAPTNVAPEMDIEYLFNADIEPDADHDGFGDETQDGCPTDATTQGQCPVLVIPDTDPPETMILRKPKDTRKSKFKYRFESFELNVTFECRLKGKGLKPAVKQFSSCTSPKKYKGLDPGKYRFAVRAIDASGNVDPTPDTDKFKILE